MNTPDWIPIAPEGELTERGAGIRFDMSLRMPRGPEAVTGFVVRHRGVVHGWVNQCRHVAVELDWVPGQFFDSAGDYLLCSVHGAAYAPDTGICVSGPCVRDRLLPVPIEIREGVIGWISRGNLLPPITTTNRHD
ncbi:Rieske (2Fe-2S) protein [Derxia gummosa]|uniref:Rieske (2Fe-2S) protein n=1 Tax=Derxia gummosa DSM 723 TaxID=1121388 RepID=A0A8B6XBU6_9BURK|nr:Rieske 2Fe-2S domain-containing protein [Derxia gummosa]